jgi:hypothetical protein
MIKLECTDVMNMENAIRGMRNPMNSWDKGDSYHCYDNCPMNDIDSCSDCKYVNNPDDYILGDNDLDLAQRLCKAGSDHRKFLRQIFVSVDITAPLYFWKEYDTYKVGTTANSTSTMHKIHAKEFTLDDFSYEEMDIATISLLDIIVTRLNEIRMYYNASSSKTAWYSMIQLLPSSYNQMRTCTMTYENLRNMYHARKNHKLEEWVEFTEWIKTLPYSKELIIGE